LQSLFSIPLQNFYIYIYNILYYIGNLCCRGRSSILFGFSRSNYDWYSPFLSRNILFNFGTV